jgi:hypothetical protein
MRTLLSKLTYANVVATIALFLALGGGAVYAATQLGKNAVKSKNIARNAVKSRNIASNAVKTRQLAKNAVKSKKIAANGVTERNIAKEAVSRAKLKAGTLAGLQVADAQGSVPGLGTAVSTGTGIPVPLSGTAAFTPAAGKSYELLTELRTDVVDADGSGEEACFAGVQIYVNGVPTTFLGVSANAAEEAPFGLNQIGNASTAVGMLTPGATQTITAGTFGDPGCGGAPTGTLRVTVVELG